MMISARVHYACLAMLELAMRQDDPAPVAIREIADRHGVPAPFLVQILRTLRTAGWVQSIRGSQGGYRLSVDPSKITLLDIAEAVGCRRDAHRAHFGARGIGTDRHPAGDHSHPAGDHADRPHVGARGDGE